MIRTLTLIAAVSFVLALGCLAGVMAAVGGPFWIDDGGMVHRVDWRASHSRHDGDVQAPASQPGAPKDFTWPGGHKLLVNVPADVTYTQGAATKLVITGPDDLVRHVVVRDGAIEADDDDFDFDRGRLKISLTAPDVSRFAINGDERLDIAGYDHDDLELKISGSGTATAHGRTKQADLRISGSGDADLTGLAIDDARVDVSGSGDATLAAKASAEVSISGSGDVRLLNAPRTESVNISGSGRVDQPDRK